MVGPIGNWSTHLRVTFTNYIGWTTYTVEAPVCKYAVKAPDGARLAILPVSPLLRLIPIVNPPGMPNLTVQFEVRGGGRRLHIAPELQEKITRSTFGLAPDQDWVAAAFLTINDGLISDGKGVQVTNAIWATIADGARLDELTEELALILPLSTGGMQRFSLGAFHFKFSKVTGQNWQLSQ